MSELPLVEPDLALLREGRVLIDVRAPVEFAQGALPGAVNLPLMDDDERHLVGIEYKARGQAAASALGERLVAGEVKAARVAAWCELLARHPDAVAISVTPVMPGPVKDCALARLIQAAALVELDALVGTRGWDAELVYRETARAGPEALLAVSAAPEAVKRATVDLEDRHPLGRLWDIDVVTATATLSRRDLGLAPRRCLVCGAPAHACARSRAHPLSELIGALDAKVGAWVFMG